LPRSTDLRVKLRILPVAEGQRSAWSRSGKRKKSPITRRGGNGGSQEPTGETNREALTKIGQKRSTESTFPNKRKASEPGKKTKKVCHVKGKKF